MQAVYNFLNSRQYKEALHVLSEFTSFNAALYKNIRVCHVSTSKNLSVLSISLLPSFQNSSSDKSLYHILVYHSN